jgi:hypothetical protein
LFLFLIIVGICLLTAGVGLLVTLISQDYLMWGVRLFSIEENGFVALRIFFGGIPLALGIFPLIVRDPVTFQMLGFTYLVCGVVLFAKTHNNPNRGVGVWGLLIICLSFGGILISTPWLSY